MWRYFLSPQPTMKDESIIQEYYKELNNADEIGKYIEKFYSTLFKLTFSVERVMMFYRLVRGYGRNIVFLSIVDIYNSTKEIDHTNIYPLLVYICKKSLLGSVSSSDSISLSSTIEEIMEKLEKQKTTKRKLNFPRFEDD